LCCCASALLTQDFRAGGHTFTVIERAGGDAFEIGLHGIDGRLCASVAKPP
jgi:hypothetical protein